MQVDDNGALLVLSNVNETDRELSQECSVQLRPDRS